MSFCRILLAILEAKQENGNKTPALSAPRMVGVGVHRCFIWYGVILLLGLRICMTLGNGYLGSRVDEERSKMRYLV